MEYNTLTELLSATCDAIREKYGSSELIPVQDIPQMIKDMNPSMSQKEFVQRIRGKIGTTILDPTGHNTNITISDTDMGYMKIPSSLGTNWYFVGTVSVVKDQKYTISSNYIGYGRFGFFNSKTTSPGTNNYADLTPTGLSANQAVLIYSTTQKKLSHTFKANFTGDVYLWFCSDANGITGKPVFETYVFIEEGDNSTVLYKAIPDEYLDKIYQALFNDKKTYLYNNGDLCEKLTGGWTNSDYTFTRNGSTVNYDSPIYASNSIITIASSDSDSDTPYLHACGCGTVKKINLNGYTKIKVTMRRIQGGWHPTVYVVNEKENISTSTKLLGIALNDSYELNNTHVLERDISELNDEYYLVIHSDSYKDGTRIGEVLSIWLE